MSNPILETLKHNMRQALSQGRLLDAEDVLTRLKQEDPLSCETRGFELEFYLRSNRLVEASALATQVCQLFPESSRIFFLAGKLAYREKHYEDAEFRFRESQRIYPHWQNQYWLGKTLTQTGKFEEAESLLLAVREHTPYARLALAWLHERRNDLVAALEACDSFLKDHPGHIFAAEQRLRIKARMLEPEDLIEEVNTLAELGEEVSDALLPEFIQKLFETGQAPRARAEISSRLEGIDVKLGARLAWICYQAQAYDLACTLFLACLQVNLSNYKYLTALESAASKCNRLTQVFKAYRALVPQAPHLYGRGKALKQRIGRISNPP